MAEHEAETLARMLAERSAARSRRNRNRLRRSTLDPARVIALAKEAISQGRCLGLVYHGHGRVIEVHIVGRTTRGNGVISGYQVAGGSTTPLPGWRNPAVDDIEAVELDERASHAPRPDYNPDDPVFEEVYARV